MATEQEGELAKKVMTAVANLFMTQNDATHEVFQAFLKAVSYQDDRIRDLETKVNQLEMRMNQLWRKEWPNQEPESPPGLPPTP